MGDGDWLHKQARDLEGERLKSLPHALSIKGELKHFCVMPYI